MKKVTPITGMIFSVKMSLQLDCTAAIRRLRFPHHIQYCEKHYGIAGRLIAQSLLCHSQLTAAECQALAFELAGEIKISYPMTTSI